MATLTKRSISVALSIGLSLSTLGLVLGGTPSQAAPPDVHPQLVAPEGQTAVKDGDIVGLSGTVEPGSTKVQALLRLLKPDGDPARNDLDITNEFTIAADGTIQGTSRLSSLPIEADRGAFFFILTAEKNGERQTGTSPALDVDLTKPRILQTANIAKDRIGVTFSESVSSAQPISDLVLDWTIWVKSDESANPINITGSGAARTLELAPSIHDMDEDATPRVRYVPQFPKSPYVDRAGHVLAAANRDLLSRDLTAPSLTAAIQEIAGKTGKNILANDVTPTVKISQVSTARGHFGQVWLETGKQEGFQADGANKDDMIGEAAAGAGNVATVQLDLSPAQGENPDGLYSLYGVSRDKAVCDPNTADSGSCPNRTAPDAGSYRLDTVVPEPVFAEITSGSEIRVRFTESVGPSLAGTWTINGIAPESVEGEFAERTLTSTAPLTAFANVSWAPNGADGFKDDAGNAVLPFTLQAEGGLPPIVTVSVPGNKLWTSAGSLEMRGGSNKEWTTYIQIYRGTDTENLPEEACQDTAVAASTPECIGRVTTDVNGDWRMPVGLFTDQDNEFIVQGVKINPETGLAGRFGEPVDVPTIVQDSTLPQPAVEPIGRVLNDPTTTGLRGGEATTIEWSVVETNPVLVTLEYSLNDGQTWTFIANSNDFSGSQAWTAPGMINGVPVNTDKALVRVTVQDRAGNRANKRSDTFVIDSRPPDFRAQTIAPTKVRVLFSEAVTLSTNPAPAEWKIDDGRGVEVPAGDAQEIMDTKRQNMVAGLELTTGLYQGFPQTLDPNAEPIVIYEPPSPIDSVEDLVGYLIDASSRAPRAADLIKPKSPTAQTFVKLTRATSVPATGVVHPDDADSENILLARRVNPAGSFAGTVTNSGAFSVTLGLAKDRANAFDLLVRDPSGNISETPARIVIENDSTAPRITVRKPQVRKTRGKRFIRVRWSSVELHKSSVKIEFKSTGSAFARKLRMVVKSTADDGSFIWRAPSWLKGRKVKVFVTGTDSVGNARRVASRMARVR